MSFSLLYCRFHFGSDSLLYFALVLSVVLGHLLETHRRRFSAFGTGFEDASQWKRCFWKTMYWENVFYKCNEVKSNEGGRSHHNATCSKNLLLNHKPKTSSFDYLLLNHKTRQLKMYSFSKCVECCILSHTIYCTRNNICWSRISATDHPKKPFSANNF